MRVCFVSQVAPEHLDAYREAHAHVWPEMLQALRDTGWCDYTLHLSDTGLLVGVVDVDSYAAAQARMTATEVNTRWQEAMSRLFAADGAPDEGMRVLPEIFNLDAQLTAAGLSTTPPTVRVRGPVMTTATFTPAAQQALREQTVELPSWAFGNSGTRFKVFGTPGTPRDPYEKLSDAAQVHRYTGITPRVSLHIPWDLVDDYTALAEHARAEGVAISVINSNLFQDDDYKFGSLTNPDPAVRAKAVAHHLQCLDVMHATGSKELKLWLPDGLNYPGQDDLAARQERLAESLRQIYTAMADDETLLIEYKFFEPAFYATDIPDWGTSLLHCMALGERAKVVLDTGHHAPGTNIEFIVMQLLRAGRLGAFDFNSRFYADDDLMVGAADPFQLFRIMHEIVKEDALAPTSGVNFMLDQCHNIEPKIQGQIRSVMNVQEATAKALLVDTEALAEAQRAGDVLAANGALMDAYHTDVRPALAELREAQGLDGDPVAAFRASGYEKKVADERVGGTQAGWGA